MLGLNYANTAYVFRFVMKYDETQYHTLNKKFMVQSYRTSICCQKENAAEFKYHSQTPVDKSRIARDMRYYNLPT